MTALRQLKFAQQWCVRSLPVASFGHALVCYAMTPNWSAPQRLGQYPHELSGGLRQRVMIAMALMCGPDLIVADEPTTALDVTVQAELLHLLMELQKEFGMGLVLITHDLGIVSRIADRICVMYAGQVVESGTPAQIFGSSRHPQNDGPDALPAQQCAQRRGPSGDDPRHGAVAPRRAARLPLPRALRPRAPRLRRRYRLA
ncbi:hypothetical protein CHELA1G11_40058 [Hyphomicrobiales bacterium]|nr:hypothetical protein CHELA1G11_40058 [Hyphomicrobiales bacterium]CAH1696472.1 hypothetical protein CHELA1G2_40083 [Hyphomicrobiales bacterium]